MTETKNRFKEIIFAIVFILSCFTMNSDHLKGYCGTQKTSYIFMRFALIIFFLFVITLMNKKNIDFISKFVPITTVCITALLIFDYYITQFSGSIFLFKIWWISYIMVANATVFLTLTVFKTDNYKNFYYNFWYGFTPIYVFTLIICFLRTPYEKLTTNFRLGNGTFLMLKSILNHNKSFEPYLLFIGNIIIFLPLPFVLSAIIKKIKPYQLALIGFAAPFIVEGYQYIFKCGDVDIDDIVLNWLGFFIGFLIQRIINKRLLTKSE